jgi:hypothetical protein
VAVGDPARASAVADHDGDVGVQVDAAHGQADDLGAAHPARLEHEADERGVPQLEEVRPWQAFSSVRRSSTGTTGTACSGTVGGRMVVIGLVSMSRSRTAQP